MCGVSGTTGYEAGMRPSRKFGVLARELRTPLVDLSRSEGTAKGNFYLPRLSIHRGTCYPPSWCLCLDLKEAGVEGIPAPGLQGSGSGDDANPR